MKRTLIPSFILSVSIAACFACGSAESDQSYRKVAQATLDAVVVQPVKLSFSLPSRTNLGLDAKVLQQNMNGYAWRIVGQGERCVDSKIHESYGPYEDARTYAMELSASCNYLVKIMVGKLKTTSALNLTATINFESHIKPVIQQNCVSCHAGYQDFNEVQKNARSIVAHIENETMPPAAPLDGSIIALFLAWADDGYQQKDPNPSIPTAAEEALSEIYYRNNSNDMINNYELLGRTSYELRRSLWIQPAGEALNLANDQIYTFRTSLTLDSNESR